MIQFLQVEVCKFLPQAIETLASLRVSLARVETFLLLPRGGKDPHTPPGQVKVGIDELPPPAGVSVELSDVCAAWGPPPAPPTLDHVSLRVDAAALVVVVGPVASGKSSLLLTLAQELPVATGSMRMAFGTRVVYVSQQAFVFSGTVRENITFGLPYIPALFDKVCAGCALDEDMTSWAGGAETYVGERGISLSGGQRARLSLARGVYQALCPPEGGDATPPLVLLDDVLSALDARTGRRVWDGVVKGLLVKTSRVVVTHALQFLRDGSDAIYLLEGGRVAQHGTFAELAAAAAAGGGGGAALLAVLAGETDAPADEVDSVLTPPEVVAPHPRAPTFTPAFTRDASLAGGLGGASPSNVQAAVQRGLARAGSVTGGALTAKEGSAVGGVSASVYASYASAAGGTPTTLYLFFLLAAGAVVGVLSSVYLAKWTANPSGDLYPAVYGGLVALLLAVSVWRAIAVFHALVGAGKSLHDAALTRVCAATLAWFSSQPSGRA